MSARRLNYKPYFFLVGFLFFVLSINKKDADKLREVSVACVAPAWKFLDVMKTGMVSFLSVAPLKGGASSSKEQLQKLALENQAMKNQIENLRSYLLFEDRLEDQWQRFKEISSKDEKELFWKDFFRRRTEHLCTSLQFQYQTLTARVIFREPISWSSSFWLNVGEKDNEALGHTIVSKNSPVVIGDMIVGFVDYVAPQKCRVRLITDSGLVCSVRAIRGGQQDRLLSHQIDALLAQLNVREDLWNDENDRKTSLQQLANLKSRLDPQGKDEYMAKGELSGSGRAMWRGNSDLLKGVGFNYDFTDQEGPARDLRSGNPADAASMPSYLLKVGDLLVTTGMDGIFPPDFKIGIVTKIHPLREGGCSYEIEARSVVENLQEIKEVFVLPSLSFED